MGLRIPCAYQSSCNDINSELNYMKKKSISTEQALRYNRQILLQGFDLQKQETLINTRALVIGAGGLGCAALQYLAAAGIGAVTIVDDDTVETTNLQRQILHYETSVGNKKVDSAARTLRQINRFLEITTIDRRLSQSALEIEVQKHDIVLDCSDNLRARNQINDVCYAHNTALVSGAAIRMEGQIFCVIPHRKTACYRCISHYFGEQHLTCVESGVMSPIVGIIGAMQALESIKIVTNYGEPTGNNLHIFDGMSSQWQVINVNPQATCPTCCQA